MVNKNVLNAANELEDIAAMAKQMADDLRNGAPNAYARVYWLRWRLGLIVRTLGVGVPQYLDRIGSEYEQYLQE